MNGNKIIDYASILLDRLIIGLSVFVVGFGIALSLLVIYNHALERASGPPVWRDGVAYVGNGHQ